MSTVIAKHRGRPKAFLTTDEQQIIETIPAAQSAVTQWSVLQKLHVRSLDARLQLGKSLITVHSKLASKPGNTKGLFYKWLTVIGLNHQSAYDYMAKAEPKKFRHGYSTPSRKRRIKINALLVRLRNAESQREKLVAFRVVCAFIKSAYSVN